LWAKAKFMILRPGECDDDDDDEEEEEEEEEEEVWSESALPSSSWSHVSIMKRWS
jgi:hypothetical protein